MSYGLEVLDAGGTVALDESDLSLRYVTIANPYGTSGTFSAEGCTDANSYVYTINLSGISGPIRQGATWGPNVSHSISGGLVSWSSNISLEGDVFLVVFRYR